MKRKKTISRQMRVKEVNAKVTFHNSLPTKKLELSLLDLDKRDHESNFNVNITVWEDDVLGELMFLPDQLLTITITEADEPPVEEWSS